MAITRQTAGNTLAGTLMVTWLERSFVPALRDNLVAVPFARKSTLTENNGKTVLWQFFSNPVNTVASVTITAEGDDPVNSNDPTTTTATATLVEYGSFTSFGKYFQKTIMAGSMEEIRDFNAYHAANILDTITMDAADATTATVDAGTAMTADAIRQAVAKLEIANAKRHSATGGKFFVGLLSAEACYDMMGEGAPAWFQVKSRDYFDSLITPFDNTPPASAIYNCIIKMANNVQVNTAEDYNLVFGNDGFGVSSLDTNETAPRLIFTDPESLVSAPVRNRGTVGWWALFAAKLIDSNRVVCVRSDVS